MSRSCKGSSRRTSIASCVQDVFRCNWMIAALVLLAGKSSFSLRLASLHLNIPKGRVSSLVSKMSSSSSSSGIPKMLEVEQKFPFSDRSRLEERLRKEGFSPVKELTMVDWYFDRFVEDSKALEMPLVRRDHWLRYRESGNEGQWQLKRGNQKCGGGGATVYEEVEGIQAVEIAQYVLREQHSSPSNASTGKATTRIFDGHHVPVLPISDCDVVPFARIVTHRAKWKQNLSEEKSEEIGAVSDLVVDLDTTPDGFAVGEVEAVVEGEDCSIDVVGTKEAAVKAETRNDQAVARARECIQGFLTSLLEEDSQNCRPPMGKLEHFLSQNRPRMYEACIESGVIPKPPSSKSPPRAT